MKQLLYRTLLASVLIPMQSQADAPFELEQGQWEFELSYNLIGLPQTFPSYRQSQCLDAATPFPSIDRPGNECTAQLQGKFGNTYTWTLDCSDDWEMVQGMGRIHFKGREAHGDVHLQILNPHNPPQMMEFTFVGNSLGKCKE